MGVISFEFCRGEPGLLRCGNHLDRRDGVTGIVIRAWITCVIGDARGAGNVGGRVLNSRSKGGRILFKLSAQRFY